MRLSIGCEVEICRSRRMLTTEAEGLFLTYFSARFQDKKKCFFSQILLT